MYAFLASLSFLPDFTGEPRPIVILKQYHLIFFKKRLDFISHRLIQGMRFQCNLFHGKPGKSDRFFIVAVFSRSSDFNLQPFGERALAVVAHPDNLEYGAASAVARRISQGKQITEAFLKKNASATGKRFGCQYAVGFEAMKF